MKQCTCGCNDFYVKEVGYQIGAYCTKCGKWQKWVSKSEAQAIKNNSFFNFDSVIINNEETVMFPKWLKKDEQTGKWHVDGNAGVCEVFDFIINLVMECCYDNK